VIGLPIWDVLSGQEPVATFAHEVAHDRGGDLLHRVLIGSSLQSLDSLYLSLRRTPSSDRPWMTVDMQGLTRSSEAMAARLLHGFAFIPRWLFFLQLKLARSASPLAEYRADQATARVASGTAATAALDKLSLAETCQSLVSRAIRTRDPEIWATLRMQLSGVPERELERLRRVARRRGETADEYHPPTCIRIRMLGAQTTRTAKLGLDSAAESAIDNELIPARRWLSETLTS
jgi:Zn-dependent protease with chaperone function